MLALLASCLPSMDKSTLDFKEHPLPDVSPQTTDEVSFEDLRANVLDAKCLECHKAWTTEFEFQKKWVVLGKPEESKMYDSVKMARMPKGKRLPDGTRAAVIPLTSRELEYFYNYIQGAKPAVAEVTFAELKTKVLETKCINCHKKMSDETYFIERYVVRGDAEKSKVYDSVIKARMPKSPKNEDGTTNPVVPLDPEEIKLIKNYINGLKPL